MPGNCMSVQAQVRSIIFTSYGTLPFPFRPGTRSRSRPRGYQALTVPTLPIPEGCCLLMRLLLASILVVFMASQSTAGRPVPAGKEGPVVPPRCPDGSRLGNSSGREQWQHGQVLALVWLGVGILTPRDTGCRAALLVRLR